MVIFFLHPEAGRVDVEQTTRASNRRTYPRLPASLRVECLTDGDAGPVHRLGSTVNVSAGGLYFQTNRGQDMQVGQTLLLLLARLSEDGVPARSRSARLWATVRRVDLPPGGLDAFPTVGGAAEFKEAPVATVLDLAG